jgi:O-antigen ligase
MIRKYQRIIDYIWLALVAVLPITSLPGVAKLLHTSAVAPASLIFLFLLTVFWLPVYLKRSGVFPFPTKIALVFLVCAFLSTFLSFFYTLPAYKDNGLFSAVAEGFATLLIGILFYLIIVIMPNSNARLRTTLQVVNWSGAVMMAWALFYLAINMTDLNLDALQKFETFFTTSILHVPRAFGFAYEPSWLANMLNMVYLPYWLASTLSKYSAHQRRIRNVTFENLLLLAGMVTLFLTYSRAGIFAFFLVLAFLFIKFNIWAIRRISQKWHDNRWRKLFTAIFILVVILVYIALVLGCIFALSKIDPRMAEVFSFQVIKEGGLSKYFDELQFGERVMYWQTGWRIFNEYPIFGVGLGNSGFFFQKLLPDSAWQMTEVRRLIYNMPGLMNIKSLWVRILAETGIVGFSVFFVLLVASAAISVQLIQSKTGMRKSIGWMGIFMLIAFVVEGFSVDSFALPYLWFTLGMVAATWRWSTIEEER